MRISDMNWMMVEEYLKRDDRCVLPLGSTEQHAYLSLSVDSILAERIAVEAAEPLGVLVFPVVAYGITPYFRAFPGSITLRVDTYLRVVGDILDAMAEQGFKRILIVNGHGGNAPAQSLVVDWMSAHPEIRIKFQNWWNAPKDYLRQLDPQSLRDYLKDGNYGGRYQREDEEIMKIWQAGVEETRQLLTEAW